MEKVIQVSNLSLRFGDKEILKDISFSVKKGSITVIIGPNGSGKTTLIKALLGLLPIYKGEVKILGEKPCKVRKKVGYVPQNFSFDRSFPITVEEFMKFSCSGCSQKRVVELLSHVGMEKRINSQLAELSGGQVQRVLIARALLRSPEIIYLDEPASGIDIGGERTFYELIAYITHTHGTTTIMVSHELDVVYKFADQVLCLNKTLRCAGIPAEVLTSDILQELYGGDISIYKHQ